jgi:hypothetical protein
LDDLLWQARVKDVSPNDPTPATSSEGLKPNRLVFIDDVIAAPVDPQALQEVVDFLKADKFELFEDDQPSLYPVPRSYRVIESTAERVSSTDIPSSDASIKKLLEKPVPDDDPRP